MPEYFFDRAGTQAGPVPADQLLSSGVTATTLVWRDGLPDWVPAASLSELASLFAAVPPPLPAPATAMPTTPLPAAASVAEPVPVPSPDARPQFSADASTRKWWHYLLYVVMVFVLLLLTRACGAVVGHLFFAASPVAVPQSVAAAWANGPVLPVA